MLRLSKARPHPEANSDSGTMVEGGPVTSDAGDRVGTSLQVSRSGSTSCCRVV